ncbi:MAG TPA: hypothetical protein VI942_05095, partial [Thermoanaerobaculia bacterium]|nr:hypothetical protein [Thermoanaerobaculia bacterium]
PEPSALAEPGTTDREPILPIVDVSTRAVLARAITARGDLERSLVALEAARAASRFSLVGAVEREEGEEVARIGLGYRLPLGGERAARARALDAALARAERDAEIERVQLAARLAAAAERAASIGAVEAPTPAAIERALAALDARLAAGKDRPSEILPARRQLYGALVTALEARVARLRLAYELETLTRETLP